MTNTTTRNRMFILVSLCSFCLLMAGCFAREPAAAARSYNGISIGESWQTIISNQDERKYLLYVPDAYDGAATVPVVLKTPWSGKTSQDIMASRLIWEFFAAHSLP